MHRGRPRIRAKVMQAMLVEKRCTYDFIRFILGGYSIPLMISSGSSPAKLTHGSPENHISKRISSSNNQSVGSILVFGSVIDIMSVVQFVPVGWVS